MKRSIVIAAATIAVIAMICFVGIDAERAGRLQRYESELVSRPSKWTRGITGITFENIEGRPEFETVVVSDSPAATKIVRNIRSALFDDEYQVENSEALSGFKRQSSWQLRIDNHLKGSVFWKIDLLTHLESGEKLLRIRYNSNGSLRFCGLPQSDSWQEWLNE